MRTILVLQCVLLAGCASVMTPSPVTSDGERVRAFKLLHVGQFPDDEQYRYLDGSALHTTKVVPPPVLVRAAPPAPMVAIPPSAPEAKPQVWTIQFPLGKASLRGNEATLKEIVQALIKDEEAIALVSGHTDALGQDRFNKRLADRRARNVARALVAMGASPGRVHFDSQCCIDNPPVVNPPARKAVIVVLSEKGN